MRYRSQPGYRASIPHFPAAWLVGSVGTSSVPTRLYAGLLLAGLVYADLQSFTPPSFSSLPVKMI
ncbi:MAG TPA: hypothetical protein VEJ87_08700, partial [Acidimicrobiales bacterium]|nr:hypothetical protein [Acidimicrobiales bacterium]